MFLFIVFITKVNSHIHKVFCCNLHLPHGRRNECFKGIPIQQLIVGNFRKKDLEKLPQHFYTLDENGFSSQICDHFNHWRMYNPTSKCLGYIPQRFLVEKIEFCSHYVDFSDVLCCSSCVQWRVLQTVTWTPCSLIMSVCGCLSWCGFVYRLCSSCICLSFLPPRQTDRDKKKKKMQPKPAPSRPVLVG